MSGQLATRHVKSCAMDAASKHLGQRGAAFAASRSARISASVASGRARAICFSGFDWRRRFAPLRVDVWLMRMFSSPPTCGGGGRERG